jgi:hypothetical protein
MKGTDVKTTYICILIFLLTAATAFAQECGPSCPVCSGAGSSSGAILSQKATVISGLLITDDDEETAVFNARHGLLNWLEAGIGYAVEADKVLWNVKVQPLIEEENGLRPSVVLGTGRVQAGGSDQSIYAQLIKSWKIDESFGTQFSVGVATLLPDADETFALAGVTFSFNDKYSAFGSYDGESFHEGISFVAADWLSLGFLMIESEKPAFSIVLKK